MSATVKPGRRIASAVAGALALVLLAWGAWWGYARVVSTPVRHVAFAGEVGRIDAADLARLEQAVLAAPGMPIEAIREAARQVPWVREATVRRVHPDGVEIRLAAHTAFGRWNDAQLVSDAGVVFAAKDPGGLPRLRGPEGSAARVVAEYPLVAAALAPVGSPLRELRLSARGGWHATLESGLAVALGRGDWKPRAERFAAAWPRLDEAARAAEYADLRYPGGFALKRVATVTPALPQGRASRP
jgi:cell division protein FtsQ